MRIPFPERVNLSYALIFATALCLIQVLQGTSIYFSGCAFAFILVSAMAFNIAGGVPYPSGAYIGFNAFFTLLLPFVVKACLGEPADSNLRQPMLTIEIYLVGMVGMLVAAVVSRRFRPRRALISGMLPEYTLHSAYVGSAVLSVILTFYIAVAPYGGNGSFSSFLVQANRFPMLTFVLGVVYIVHRSKGQRSMSWPLLGMILYVALGALLTFSKEQFLSPFFAWAITVALLGYRLSWVNIFAFSSGLIFTVTFLVPYAQYGKGFEMSGSKVEVAGYLLAHMDEVRSANNDNSAIVGEVHYYSHHLGLLDRLDSISGDDALIDVTDRQGAFGYRPIIEGFENIIPHVFYPNKPIPYYGNTYAHEINILSADDETTGVSFSPTADAYHEGRMVAVVVLEPAVLMIIFLVLDSVIGDVRLNPVGLLTTILVSRASWENAIWAAPLLMGQYLFTNVLASYVCAYVLPMLGSLFNKPLLMRPQGLNPGAPPLPSPQPVSSL
jgi:hypothetical protein